MKIGIVLGSVREERTGESVARWVADGAASREGATYELIDLKTLDVPVLPSAARSGAPGEGFGEERVRRWSAAVAAYDGFVLVTPEYNLGIPAGLKRAVESLGAEWAYKPVAFVSYGTEGGVRAVEHWRRIAAGVRMLPVRQQISLSLFTEFGPEGIRPVERRSDELAALFDQLEQAVRPAA